LRCRYCDTTHAYEEGEVHPVESLVKAAMDTSSRLVLVTGGEPLLQESSRVLLHKLLDAGLEVLLETNGSLPLRGVDTRVRRIVDVKCPGSGMSKHNFWANLEILTPRDEVKFVICDEEDFNWAVSVAERYRLPERLPVLISPAFGVLSLPQVAAWILRSGHPLRLNLQLHKYIWGSEAKGV
jgi:7-carboxy-7-deazaguanine synthase